MKVLILDTVHGGKIVAEEYLKRGCEVTAVDVYKVTPRDVLGGMVRRGIRVPDAVPEEDFDLCVRPIHCPDAFIGGARCAKVISVSDAVNELFDPYDRRFRVEVTGVKGKTSTCFILAHVLDAAGKRVYLHSSRGMGPYANGEHVITDIQSIAPATLLALPRTEYDVLVCEVSLGGSGRADISVITNLVEDYGIAKNTRRAHEGKKGVLNPNVNFVLPEEEGIWSAYGKPLRFIGRRVVPVGKPVFGEPLRVSVDYRGKHEIELGKGYLALQYLSAMDAALEVCDAMDIPAEDVIRGLESFRGVPGRGQVSVEDGRKVLRDRNPGISHMSVDYTLSCLKDMDALGNAVLVVDPVSKKVCDKMDKDLISETAGRYGVKVLFTDGQGSVPEIPADAETVIYLVKEGYQ